MSSGGASSDVQVSYHHANPSGGNESFLLRVETETPDTTTTVLVDAGERVQLDDLLAADESLDAICLTHAHLDHYSSVEQCRQADTTIYTSPTTATIISDVFDVAAREYDVITTDETVGAIQEIDGWTAISDTLDCHPIPAGHVPGAVGYLFRVGPPTADEATGHLLATGDFTLERAAGYPGFPAAAIDDVDVLFLTAATNDEFTDQMSEALGTVLQAAQRGAQTLVTASGLLGVQVAYLLNALIARHELHLQVRIVGQAAKFYDALDYECASVETQPVFDHTDECLDHETITIAGPEIPHERSSGRLFGVLRDDPNACVVQLIGSGEDPLQSGRCTIYDFEIVNHPSRDALDATHDYVAPCHTIIVHRHRGAGKEYNDLDSIVWSPTDSDEYTLYANGAWQMPPWMGGTTVHSHSIDDRSIGSLMDGELLSRLSLPDLGRHDDPDLHEEGLDLEQIKQLLAYQDASPDESPTADSAESTARGSTDESDTPTSEQSTMTAKQADPPDETSSDEETGHEPTVETTGLFRTVDPSVDQIDERLTSALETGALSPDDIRAALTIAREGAGTDPESAASTDPEDHAAVEQPAQPSHSEQSDDSSDGENESQRERGTEATADPDAVPVEGQQATAEDTSGPDQEERPTDGVDERAQADQAQPDQANDSADNDIDTDGNHPESPNTPTAGSPGEPEGQVTVELDTLTAALAGFLAAQRENSSSIATVAHDATLAYLADHLRGTVSVETPPTVEFSASPVLEAALAAVVDNIDDYDDIEELPAPALGQFLSELPRVDATVETTAVDIAVEPTLVDALVANESSGLTTRREVVLTAIRWYVGTQSPTP